MTIARAQMYRQLYQMGGIGSLPMDYGQPLQVPQQMQPSFSSAQNITMNPLLNYGQPQLGGGTPLTMAGGGISRLGYQEGGMGMEQMMQEQMMQQAPEGIMNAMPQEAGGAQQGLSQEKGTMSLAIIIKLLIDQGIDPETAKQLAIQIQQAFAQGGEAGVEEFANQLEQQEGMQEMAMMANGGIMSYAQRQNYGFGSIFKSVGKAVKSVAKAVKSVVKSDIGKLVLTAAAVYFGGPMLASSFGISGAAGAAWAGGLANSALQIASGQKFNIGEALLSAGGAYVGAGGLSGTPTPPIDPLTGLSTNTITGTVTQPSIQIGALESNLGQFNPSITPGITGTTTQPSSFFSPTEYGSTLSTPVSTGLEGQVGTGYATPPPNQPFQLQGSGSGSPVDMKSVYGDYSYPNTIDKFSTKLSDFGNQATQYLGDTATSFMNDPLATVGRGISNTYDLAKKYPAETILAATAALGALSPQQPGEPDDTYQQRKAEYDSRVAEYITLYGGEAKVYSPEFYKMEKAVDPFAGRSTYAAMGGRIGYEYGSMPMGEPRKNPAGIMELDYRAKGGFVPPVGIKEKADDIPAMLSNNEFVFTANAVRNAGGGNVNKGAERMYGLMKQLEAGGMV